jgi:hypothetical protein
MIVKVFCAPGVAHELRWLKKVSTELRCMMSKGLLVQCPDERCRSATVRRASDGRAGSPGLGNSAASMPDVEGAAEP